MAIESRPSPETDDPEIWSLLQRDHTRQHQTLNFIASENYAFSTLRFIGRVPRPS
jgi:glycine/serine hydroxymethyltransferase